MEQLRQIGYLHALGIDVWVRRETPNPSLHTEEVRTKAAPSTGSQAGRDAGRGLFIGPGDGRLLLLCGGPEDASLPIAADIARCLDGEPVWGWPVTAGDAGEGTTLEGAIRDRLFTGVLMFGAVCEAAASGAASAVQGSARILCTRSLPELADEPDARRSLWQMLRATDWVAKRRTGTGK